MDNQYHCWRRHNNGLFLLRNVKTGTAALFSLHHKEHLVFVCCISAESNWKALLAVILRMQRIIGVHLPALEDIYSTYVLKKATRIWMDAIHPRYTLFEFFPSSKCSGVFHVRTLRFRDSFIPKATITPNQSINWPYPKPAAFQLELSYTIISHNQSQIHVQQKNWKCLFLYFVIYLNCLIVI